MNFSNLIRNIRDVVIEDQLKLGYRKEKIRLYYPLSSLNNFLDTSLKLAQMTAAMEDFTKFFAGEEGPVEITHNGDRFCFVISEAAVLHIHDSTPPESFISELINAVQIHGITFPDIVDIFRKHSSHVHVEELDNGEFNYLVYFEDGVPDDYYYCFAVEECHVTYHRFTPDDYRGMGF